MWLLLPLLVALVVKDALVVSSSQPSVVVGDATIYGSSVQVGDVTVDQYLGVRFAQPPKGSLRFSKPVASVLSGVVNATTYPSTCPGLTSILGMDEDCLSLSLYVPQSSRGQNGDQGMSVVPVMVWLFGGGFVFGSGSQYDGSRLAAEGKVIVVTPNYRVGPLGFLSTGDNSSVGNYGLWDQWLALKWVQDNIGAFGGDVTRVTLFGESAGAASVSYHMTSRQSQGLFHRAILQSGSRLCPWASDELAVTHAKGLGRMLSCSDVESTSALVSCLRGQPWKSLQPLPFLTQVWGPVVDGDFVLPFNQSATFPGPMMVGVNNREGGMLLRVHKSVYMDANKRATHLDIVLKTIRRLYPSLASSATQSAETLAARTVDCMYRQEGSTESHATDEELEGFVGDVEIMLGCQQFLDSDPATGPSYQYYFDHYPDNIRDGDKGMDHAMDIDYTFGILQGMRAPYSPFYNQTVSDRDRLLGKRYRTLLTNFAHSGNPNQPTELPGWPEWQPYVKGNSSYLGITFSPRVASHLEGDRMRTWLETVPRILRSQEVASPTDTRWSRCIKQDTGHSPAHSASVFLIVGASLWAALSVFLE